MKRVVVVVQHHTHDTKRRRRRRGEYDTHCLIGGDAGGEEVAVEFPGADGHFVGAAGVEAGVADAEVAPGLVFGIEGKGLDAPGGGEGAVGGGAGGEVDPEVGGGVVRLEDPGEDVEAGFGGAVAERVVRGREGAVAAEVEADPGVVDVVGPAGLPLARHEQGLGAGRETGGSDAQATVVVRVREALAFSGRAQPVHEAAVVAVRGEAERLDQLALDATTRSRSLQPRRRRRRRVGAGDGRHGRGPVAAGQVLRLRSLRGGVLLLHVARPRHDVGRELVDRIQGAGDAFFLLFERVALLLEFLVLREQLVDHFRIVVLRDRQQPLLQILRHHGQHVGLQESADVLGDALRGDAPVRYQNGAHVLDHGHGRDAVVRHVPASEACQHEVLQRVLLELLLLAPPLVVFLAHDDGTAWPLLLLRLLLARPVHAVLLRLLLLLLSHHVGLLLLLLLLLLLWLLLSHHVGLLLRSVRHAAVLRNAAVVRKNGLSVVAVLVSLVLSLAAEELAASLGRSFVGRWTGGAHAGGVGVALGEAGVVGHFLALAFLVGGLGGLGGAGAAGGHDGVEGLFEALEADFENGVGQLGARDKRVALVLEDFLDLFVQAHGRHVEVLGQDVADRRGAARVGREHFVREQGAGLVGVVEEGLFGAVDEGPPHLDVARHEAVEEVRVEQAGQFAAAQGFQFLV
mmetsp:Transcript_12910/g.38984  ORF Transcript_12910/g.38984 Transcript_12910/m.38984 type:complete len:685 (-) Transcript_12910:718-2772(-)